MKKKVKLKDVKKTKGKTDWKYLQKTNEEVQDVEAPALSISELNQMKKVKKG